MLRSIFIGILCIMAMPGQGLAQPPAAKAGATYVYHPPSEDKPSWQRLNLWLSSTYILAAKEGQADFDSCLLTASRSLGMSRLPILAEGLDDPELLAQSRWIDRQDPATGLRQLSQSSGKERLGLLLLLGAYYAFQPHSYWQYRDSVEYFLTKATAGGKAANEGKMRRQALCLLLKIYLQANALRSGDSVFSLLMKECTGAGDEVTRARAFAYRGIYLPPSPATAMDMIDNLQKAAGSFGALKEPEGQILAYTDIGYLLMVAGRFEQARNWFLQALRLEDSIHYPYTHYNTDAVTMAGQFEGKFGEPLRYALQTVNTAEACRDSIGWGYFYNRLAFLYYKEGGKEEESERYWKKGFHRFVLDRSTLVYNIMPFQIDRLGDRGQAKEALQLVMDLAKIIPAVSFTDQFEYNLAIEMCHKKLRQFDSAKAYLAKADSIETRVEAFIGPLRKTVIYVEYGGIFTDEGKYLKAREYYIKYLSAVPENDREVTNLLGVYRALIEGDSALHDDAARIAHYSKYTELLDSSFNVSRIRQAEELQVMYQTQEKENQIAILNQQAKLEQANLQQATLIRNVTIIGIIGIFIIAGLLYRQSRTRKKNNVLITHKNEQLQHFLDEKEWLLREIHHRVKNNLQIVMSLLHSQSAYIDNEPALAAIHDSQHRVHAMSLIHQKLYGSQNVSSISMPVYIQELITYLADSFDTGRRIRFEQEVDPIDLDVGQAVPLGLILNEAITNSIKYAFPEGRTGLISIRFLKTPAGPYLLEVSDNGVGMPPHIDTRKPGSLGMSLMRGLSEDLNGEFSLDGDGGTRITISFAEDPGVKESRIPGTSDILSNKS